MKEMVGFCGIVCNECPAFIATQKDDWEKRKRVAEMWSKEFGAEIRPESINCDGCISKSERLFSHAKVCEIRMCGLERGVKNCAYCEEYPCNKLDKLFKMVPEAKTTLERIRKRL
jgi:hypothetical protein